jgi:hypothetical protein
MKNNDNAQLLRAEYLNIAATIGCFVAGLAISITLWTSTNSRLDAQIAEHSQWLAAFYQESKDFHARLVAIESAR